MTAVSVGDWVWQLDLVAGDDAVRGHASAEHKALLVAFGAEQWPQRQWYWRRSIFGPLEVFWNHFGREEVLRSPAARFVLLYLQWEARYPDEWESPGAQVWSRWGIKEVLLHRMARYGVPEVIRSGIGELLVAALRRPYRCKDWRYGQVVRHVWDERLADAVTALRDADDPLIRSRARFVLHLVEHPEEPVTRTSWRRWGGPPRPDSWAAR